MYIPGFLTDDDSSEEEEIIPCSLVKKALETTLQKFSVKKAVFYFSPRDDCCSGCERQYVCVVWPNFMHDDTHVVIEEELVPGFMPGVVSVFSIRDTWGYCDRLRIPNDAIELKISDDVTTKLKNNIHDLTSKMLWMKLRLTEFVEGKFEDVDEDWEKISNLLSPVYTLLLEEDFMNFLRNGNISLKRKWYFQSWHFEEDVKIPDASKAVFLRRKEDMFRYVGIELEGMFSWLADLNLGFNLDLLQQHVSDIYHEHPEKVVLPPEQNGADEKCSLTQDGDSASQSNAPEASQYIKFLPPMDDLIYEQDFSFEENLEAIARGVEFSQLREYVCDYFELLCSDQSNTAARYVLDFILDVLKTKGQVVIENSGDFEQEIERILTYLEDLAEQLLHVEAHLWVKYHKMACEGLTLGLWKSVVLPLYPTLLEFFCQIPALKDNKYHFKESSFLVIMNKLKSQTTERFSQIFKTPNLCDDLEAFLCGDSQWCDDDSQSKSGNMNPEPHRAKMG